jgi:hypothetical protein
LASVRRRLIVVLLGRGGFMVVAVVVIDVSVLVPVHDPIDVPMEVRVIVLVLVLVVVRGGGWLGVLAHAPKFGLPRGSSV